MNESIRQKLAANPPKFDPGRVVMTPGAIEALANNNALVSEYLVRHVTGDWGKLGGEDLRANGTALYTGLRLFSNYPLPNGDPIWIITDAVNADEGADPRKRDVTTVLLPSDY